MKKKKSLDIELKYYSFSHKGGVTFHLKQKLGTQIVEFIAKRTRRN